MQKTGARGREELKVRINRIKWGLEEKSHRRRKRKRKKEQKPFYSMTNSKLCVLCLFLFVFVQVIICTEEVQLVCWIFIGRREIDLFQVETRQYTLSLSSFNQFVLFLILMDGSKKKSFSIFIELLNLVSECCQIFSMNLRSGL